VKFRESFRPFAPIVLESKLHEYFETTPETKESRFMLRVMRVRSEYQQFLAAATHVDGTGRVQTINEKDDPFLFKIISSFSELTQVSAVLNTSFNLRDEPIVETPLDALRCLLHSGLDYVVIGDLVARRAKENLTSLHMYPVVKCTSSSLPMALSAIETDFLRAANGSRTSGQILKMIPDGSALSLSKVYRFLSKLDRLGAISLSATPS
jgi:carbamoyltransferase